MSIDIQFKQYTLRPELYEYETSGEALEAAIAIDIGSSRFLNFFIATRDLGETYFVHVFDSRNQVFKGSIWPKADA